ncbi:hypothetical protein Ahy_A03g013146 [Arachis hypogaea]|uniref:ATP-dependent DNA helicase n=1 Tax=Arachis hypogaea TaxID=3818 RepID=A0A445DUV5_ARAHY|nr:hypothetical protein Ahy_A03g013146 [Arachis hypogaea]
MPVPNTSLVSQFTNLKLLHKLLYNTDSFLREHDANILNGIASLLLPGGKTAHFMFNIPVELTEDTVCRIKKDSPKAELI